MSTQLDKLTRLVNDRTQEENAAKKKLEDQMQKRLEILEGMKDRLEDAYQIGRTLVENNLRHESPEHLWSTEYDGYVGFVGPDFDTVCWCGYSVYGIGIGNERFYFRGSPSYRNFFVPTIKRIQLLDKLIEGFPAFEAELHKFIDNL